MDVGSEGLSMKQLQIINAVDGDRTIDFLRKLIRTRSITGEEKEITEVVARQMENTGLSTEIIGVNVVGKMQGVGRGPTLILNAHLDTVPVGRTESWSVDPFCADVKNGRIYGRGACDDKGGLAAMIMAIDTLTKANIELNGNLIMTAVTEEAGPDRGISELVGEGMILGDAAIVGEPTSLNIHIGHRTSATIEIVVKGKTAHASTPERGVNAIVKMAKIIMALDEMRFGVDPVLGKGTLNVGVITGGIRTGVVPDLCKIEINRRLIRGETERSVKDQIDKVLSRLREEDPEIQGEAEITFFVPPYLISENEPIIDYLRRSTKLVTNTEPQVSVQKFATDAAHIHRLTKIPAVIFGPGEEKAAHAPNESIEIEQVVNATKIYALTIMDFLGQVLH